MMTADKRERILVTDAQWSFIVRLMNEAFSKRYSNTPNLDVHHKPAQYLKTDASADIQRLLDAKRRGWKD